VTTPVEKLFDTFAAVLVSPAAVEEGPFTVPVAYERLIFPLNQTARPPRDPFEPV
jgi:hypothetical protein